MNLFRVKRKGKLKIFLFHIRQVGKMVITKIIIICASIGGRLKEIKFKIGVRIVATSITFGTALPLPFPVQKPEIHRMHEEAQTRTERLMPNPYVRFDDVIQERIEMDETEVVAPVHPQLAFRGDLFGRSLKVSGGDLDDRPTNKILMEACKVLMYQLLDKPEFRKHFLTSQTTNIYQHRFPRLLGADSSARELKVESSITSNHNLWKPMKKTKRDSINLENIDSPISRTQSRNANIRAVIEISLGILTVGITFYLMKLSLQRCLPVRNTLKRGGYLVASINYVPKRVPINPDRFLNPTSTVSIDLWAQNGYRLVMPPNPYRYIKSYQRQIKTILALRGGALISSEMWAYLVYAGTVLAPYVIQSLVTLSARRGYTRVNRVLRAVLLARSVVGFAVGPNPLGSRDNPFTQADQLDQLHISGRLNKLLAVYFTFNNTNITAGATYGQMDRKKNHYLYEYDPNENKMQGRARFLVRMALEAKEIYYNVSFNENYKQPEPAIAVVFRNVTHTILSTYVYNEEGTPMFRTSYTITPEQFLKLINQGRVQ